jgi:hypothetical protein
VTGAGAETTGAGESMDDLLAFFLLLLGSYTSQAGEGSENVGVGTLTGFGEPVPNGVAASMRSPQARPLTAGVDEHVHFFNFTTPRPILSIVVPSAQGASPVNMWYNVAPKPHTSTFSLAKQVA